MNAETQICIRPDGVWHRRTSTGTACGEPILGAFMTRDWILDDKLCERCFSPAERLQVLVVKIQQANEEDARDFAEAPTDVAAIAVDFALEEPTDIDD